MPLLLLLLLLEAQALAFLVLLVLALVFLGGLLLVGPIISYEMTKFPKIIASPLFLPP
jgi:hypothetical protein